MEPLEPRTLLSATGLTGDVNSDGVVNQGDLQAVVAHWNTAQTDRTDLNGDGYVGLDDLNLILTSPVYESGGQSLAPASLSASAQVTVPEQLDGLNGPGTYYTDFDGVISGNWTPIFERGLSTLDPDGQLVGPDQPRWGDAVGVSAAQAWELVRASENGVVNIGYGPGADGQWLSVWADRTTDELIAFNHDLSEWKTIDAGRDSQPVWLAQSDWESDTRYQPKTGQIVPGGLWITYLQRDVDKDADPNEQDWRPNGTSFGVVQEVTYDNVFTQARTILDSPRQPGLIDSETGEPYENQRGREWAMSYTPVVDANGRLEHVWWTITDYMQDVSVNPVKPGGTTWVFVAERDAVGDNYTLRQPRIIEQQEDPLGKDEAFEHRHSAMTVVHETGEVDVLVASGDTAPHSFLKRYRIDDPENYETSSLTSQLTGFLGNTGEASPKLISFQVGSQANKVLVATDGRDEGVLELTIPLDMTAPAQVRSVIGRGFVKTPAMTLNLELARPWERSGYAISVRPFIQSAPDLIPFEAATIFYSEDGEDWVEIAGNLGGGEIVFHDQTLVVPNAGEAGGIYKTELGTVDSVNPLLVSPGGTQRLASTLTEHTSYADTDVTFLEKVDGLWVDNGVPLPVQPPSFGPVVKVSRLGNADQINLTQIFLDGTDADFQDGGYATKVWVMPTAGQSPYLNVGHTAPGRSGDIDPSQPTSDQQWHPVMSWDTFDPYIDSDVYTPLSRLTAHFASNPHATEFYISYDLLLNQADVAQPSEASPDIDGDAVIGLSDLDLILADWGSSTIPVIVAGDINEDGFVGLDDLDIILANWNTNVDPEAPETGDINGDGFVGLTDLDFVISKWNTGTLPMDPLPTDLDKDGLVGLSDLDTLLGSWGDFRPEVGLVPGYPVLPSDLIDLTAEPEQLTWDLPASTEGDFTVAMALTVPVDGIDGTWGEDGFANGSTNYGTLYADENNYIELWNHRAARTWSLVVIRDGSYAGAVTIDDAWLNVDGRFHWAASYSETGGLKLAVLQRGNVVASASLPVTLGFTPTKLQLGSHDWLSVPTVGIKSAYYDPTQAEGEQALLDRVVLDDIYAL